jgi:hypothetical protein
MDPWHRSSLFMSYDRVREYQASFMGTVRAEVERLEQAGVRREEAVEVLLKRLRSLGVDSAGPSEWEVSGMDPLQEAPLRGRACRGCGPTIGGVHAGCVGDEDA